MRASLYILCLSIFGSLSAQRSLISAKVLDMSKEPIMGVHVSNISEGSVTVSNREGRFQLAVQVGDTLLLTSVGFQSLSVEVNDNWVKEGMVLFMREGTIQLSEVSIYSIPPIEQFKEQIIETIPEDSTFFWYFGVEKPVIRGDKMNEGRVHKKLLYAVLQPTNFLYYNLSKAEKEKRRYHEIQQMERFVDKSEMKFTREWVEEETGYVGDELTSFIAYCAYSPTYLAKTPLYLIMEDMTEKKIDFEKQKNENRKP